MTTGAAWNVDNPLKPWIWFDADAELDVPWDWADWLTQEGTTYASHEWVFPEADTLQVLQSTESAGVITARIAKADAGTLTINAKYGVTCRITDSAGQIEDQTLWFKIRQK